MDRIFPDQGLARASGGADHDGMPLVQSIDGLQLEVIEREGKDTGRIHSGWPFSAGVGRWRRR